MKTKLTKNKLVWKKKIGYGDEPFTYWCALVRDLRWEYIIEEQYEKENRFEVFFFPDNDCFADSLKKNLKTVEEGQEVAEKHFQKFLDKFIGKYQ